MRARLVAAVRSLLGGAIGGLVGGGLNGLSLYLGIPQDIYPFEPSIIAAGCWHGMVLALVVRLFLLQFRAHRVLQAAAGYAGGILGGMLGILVFVTLRDGFDGWLDCLGQWASWRLWGLLFGGPVGLALGLVAILGPARSRLALVSRNVVACEVLTALAALVFWCYAMGGGSGDFWVTGLAHGAIFGTMYALGVVVLGAHECVLSSERLRQLDE